MLRKLALNEIMVLLTCVVGEARTLSNPCVHLSLRGNVLDVMEKHVGQPGGVSVALLVKQPLVDGKDDGDDHHHHRNVSDAALSTIRPDTLRVVASRSSDERVAMCPGQPCVQSIEGPLAYDARRINAARFSLLTRCASVSACAQPFLGQLASWGSCLDVAEAMEREGRRIDAILTLRADLVWYAPFPIESLRIRHIPYLQSRTEAPLDAKAALRLSQCAMNPGCPIVPHEIGDWVFSVPRRLAHAALGAAREYCDACRRPSEKAFWVPTRVEDFLMARIARGVVRLGRNWTHRMPMLHTMPAVVLRGRSEHERQERSCSHVPVQRANLMPKEWPPPLFAGCAPLLDEACWTHPVTTHDYASRLSKIGDQLGWVTGSYTKYQ